MTASRREFLGGAAAIATTACSYYAPPRRQREGLDRLDAPLRVRYSFALRDISVDALYVGQAGYVMGGSGEWRFVDRVGTTRRTLDHHHVDGIDAHGRIAFVTEAPRHAEEGSHALRLAVPGGTLLRKTRTDDTVQVSWMARYGDYTIEKIRTFERPSFHLASSWLFVMRYGAGRRERVGSLNLQGATKLDTYTFVPDGFITAGSLGVRWLGWDGEEIGRWQQGITADAIDADTAGDAALLHQDEAGRWFMAWFSGMRLRARLPIPLEVGETQRIYLLSKGQVVVSEKTRLWSIDRDGRLLWVRERWHEWGYTLVEDDALVQLYRHGLWRIGADGSEQLLWQSDEPVRLDAIAQGRKWHLVTKERLYVLA